MGWRFQSLARRRACAWIRRSRSPSTTSSRSRGLATQATSSWLAHTSIPCSGGQASTTTARALRYVLEVAEQMARVRRRNKVRFSVVGRGGIGAGRLPRLRERVEADGAGGDRALPELRHDRLAEPRVLHLRRRQLRPGRRRRGTRGVRADRGALRAVLRRARSAGTRAPIQRPVRLRADSSRSASRPAACSAGAEGVKTGEEAALWGGTAGQQYDPCYHLACDTFANNNNLALDVNSDAVAYAVLQYGMSTFDVNQRKGKGNFKKVPPPAEEHPLPVQ